MSAWVNGTESVMRKSSHEPCSIVSRSHFDPDKSSANQPRNLTIEELVLKNRSGRIGQEELVKGEMKER